MHHPIVLKVYKYFQDVREGRVEPPTKERLDEYARTTAAALGRQLSPPQRKDFTLRMSNVGRPLCQLQMEAAGVPEEQTGVYNAPMRNSFGDIIEASVVFILREAGVRVLEEQKQVALDVDGVSITGTFDVKLGETKPLIYDIKSASKYAFANKLASFQTLAENDSFGYLAQGYGYAEADGTPFGGLIVINKESGEWNVIEPPPVDDEYRARALQLIKTNVKAITEKAPFERQFTDVVETFRKRETGNRYLGSTCGFCPYKKSCWVDLKYLPQAASAARNPKHFWYTHVEEKINENID